MFFKRWKPTLNQERNFQILSDVGHPISHSSLDWCLSVAGSTWINAESDKTSPSRLFWMILSRSWKRRPVHSFTFETNFSSDNRHLDYPLNEQASTMCCVGSRGQTLPAYVAWGWQVDVPGVLRVHVALCFAQSQWLHLLCTRSAVAYSGTWSRMPEFSFPYWRANSTFTSTKQDRYYKGLVQIGLFGNSKVVSSRPLQLRHCYYDSESDICQYCITLHNISMHAWIMQYLRGSDICIIYYR